MSFQRGRSAAAGVLAATLALATVPALAQDRAFQFGLVGDTAYSKQEEAEFERVIAALNTSDLAFVIHVGDFQNDPRPHNRNPDRSSVPCVEESYTRVLASFQRVRHPFILTPGDNDWTDCHHLAATKVDPLEALATVRKMFYPKGKSLGQRTKVETGKRSSVRRSWRTRWSIGGVTFATRIVGSNTTRPQS
jgi:predicted phosphodiesterase